MHASNGAKLAFNLGFLGLLSGGDDETCRQARLQARRRQPIRIQRLLPRADLGQGIIPTIDLDELLHDDRNRS